MIQEIINLIILTFIPTIELRGSIPYGIIHNQIPVWIVVIVVIITNILLGLFVFFLLKYLTELLITVKWIEKLYNKSVERVHRKVKKYVDKYGTLGLAIFISIPFPGSGVYTGALAAYVFGIETKDFIIAETIGVLVAATIVTILTLSGILIF